MWRIASKKTNGGRYFCLEITPLRLIKSFYFSRPGSGSAHRWRNVMICLTNATARYSLSFKWQSLSMVQVVAWRDTDRETLSGTVMAQYINAYLLQRAFMCYPGVLWVFVSHWNKNVVTSTKLSSLAALEVVILTTSSAASDEHFIKMKTLPFQCMTEPNRGDSCLRTTTNTKRMPGLMLMNHEIFPDKNSLLHRIWNVAILTKISSHDALDVPIQSMKLISFKSKIWMRDLTTC